MSSRGTHVNARYGWSAVGAALVAAIATLVPIAPAYAAAPSNDDFAGAQVLSVGTAVTGSTVEATAEVGEPAHYMGVDAGASIWYRWTSPDTDVQPMMQLWTRGSDFDTVLAVYTGGPGVADLVQLGSNDDSGALTSRVQFQPTRDTTYYIAVDGCCGGGFNDTGSIRLRLSEALAQGSIEGFVTDGGGAGVDGFCAEAVDETGEPITHPGFTDASGWYVINGVPVGTDRHVRFRNCGSSTFAGEFNGDSQTLAGAGNIVVQEGVTTSGVNAVLAVGGSLTGTVSADGPVDPTSLAGVCVRATMVGEPDDGFTRSVVTDAAGDYAIDGLDGGDYRVRFGGDCGANSELQAEFYDDATDPVDADLVAVTEGATVTGIDAGLAASPGAISGTVREWEVGPGIANICVRTVGPSYTSPSVDTNVNGDYTIPNVPAGTDHIVRFSDCHASSNPYTTQWYNRALKLDDAEPVTVTSGHTTGSINASMFRAATLGGQVTDANGNGRAGACAGVYDADGPIRASTQGDADGVWSVQVPPGTYEIELYDCDGGLSFETRWYLDSVDQTTATEVFVDQGDVEAGLDQMLPGTPGTDGRIVGRVTDDSVDQLPLEGVCVSATRAGIGTDTVTGADGRYEFDALLPDDYTVEFYACDGTVTPNLLDQYWNDVTDISLASAVTVSAGTTTSGIIARMHPGGSITGVVTNAADVGIADVCVTASPPDGSAYFGASTDALGAYEIIGLPTGSYEVSFEDCSYEYIPEWYDDQPFPDGDPTPVDVVAGQETSGIDATLARNGTISGTVTNEAGDPLVDICTVAYTADDELAWFGGTDETGQYLIGNLVTGSYKVLFSDCSSGPTFYGDEFYDNELDPGTATLVSVTLGQDTGGIDAVMQDTAPVNTALPEVDGTATVGETLTALNGTWDHPPSEFAYEWFRCDSAGDNCAPINAATDPTYLLTQDDFDHRIGVTVTASNSIGDTPATSALSDVVDRVPPPNDDIADRQVLVGTTNIEVDGANYLATREPGEPDHLGYTQGASVWYEWTAPTGGDALPAVQMSLAGSSFNTTLSVYTGTPTPFSGLDLVAQNQYYNVSFISLVGFAPVPGTTYYIAVDGAFDGTSVSEGTVRLEISRTNGISGRVTDAGGNPIQGICARAYDAGFGSMGEAYTDANGDYLIPALDEGDYKIDFEDCDLVYVEEWYDDQPDFDSANLVHVTNGEVTTDIDAELARYGTISGRVTDEQGDPVYDPSCGVYAYNTLSGFSNSARIDQDGYYTIGFLQTGTYQVEFSTCTDVDYGIEWYDNKLSQGDATEISVTFGQDTGGIDAVLQDQAPANTTLPAITGSTLTGGTLTATQGLWDHEPSTFAYQWLRCDITGAGCLPIVDADGSTYVTTNDDAGHRLRVAVTATNSIGSTTAESDMTAPVGRPFNLSLPTITGSASVGSTLTGSTGTWTGNPSSYAYQWRRCDDGGVCVSIGGATASTYVVVGADVGSRLRVRVTATNASGSTTAQSAATVVTGAPVLVSTPTVTGSPAVGATLTGTNGTWTGDPTAYAYEWQRCDTAGASCVVIGGATASTYVPTGTDAGTRLRIRVTATNAVGSTSARSAATPVIGAPVLVSSPTISGSRDIGATLTASTGTWDGNPTSYAYEWLRCDTAGAACVVIGGATASTYVTTGADGGARLRVLVTATNAVASVSGQSGPTAAIGVPVVVSVPTISGQAQVGSTQTAGQGTWTGTPTSYAYQWLRCDTAGASCVEIGGATASTYVAAGGDAGSRLRVRVTATNSAGSTSSQSGATAVIGALTATGRPRITGNPDVGSTLSIVDGGWTATPAGYAYQWQRCDDVGADCAPIVGAEDATYLTTSEDAGARLRVKVTAMGAGGNGSSRSPMSATIGLPRATSAPWISGQMYVGWAVGAIYGDWMGDPTSYATQWLRCDTAPVVCTPIDGADSSGYTVSAEDEGHRLRIKITATNALGSTTAVSPLSRLVTVEP